jgi:hypothetical protein
MTLKMHAHGSQFVLCTSQCESPQAEGGGGGGGGDLAGKVVSYDCKYMSPMMGDLDGIFS